MQADAAVVGSLVEAERTGAAAYRMGAGHMSGADRQIARRFLAQEEDHERALERALRSLGAAPPPRRRDADYTAGFPPLTSSESALRFALDIENTQISAYEDALGTIAAPSLRVTAASILTTEAEHMSVILGQLHEPQAPQAFVTGNKPT